MRSGARKADRDERVRDIIAGGTGCVRRGLPRSSGWGRCEAFACRISRLLAAGCPRSKMRNRVRKELQFARFDGESVQTCPAAAVRARRGSRAAELASWAVSPMAARIRRMAHE